MARVARTVEGELPKSLVVLNTAPSALITLHQPKSSEALWMTAMWRANRVYCPHP
jgi:hypothetical protein